MDARTLEIKAMVNQRERDAAVRLALRLGYKSAGLLVRDLALLELVREGHPANDADAARLAQLRVELVALASSER